MSDEPTPTPSSSPAPSDEPKLPKTVWMAVGGVAVIVGVTALSIFYWFFCRIEVPQEHVGVLIAKTGDDLPSGEIIATSESQKGIQLRVLKPGRYFYNPLFWDSEVQPFTTVHANMVGVLVRRYGESPDDPSKNLLVPYETANGHKKGIVREVLKPGQYPLNPYAYAFQEFPAVVVPAGYVGVVCNQVGDLPKASNTYLVEDGERGVQREVLGQGAHYLNPYEKQVYLVDIRSQRLEFSGQVVGGQEGERKALSAVRFPSNDGFEIEVRLTVEWSIDRARAPEVFVRIGTGNPKTLLAEVLDKTLIPALRGNARIQGSKYPASDYISGESRTKFQESIFDGLKTACGKQGILIRSVLVNDIDPPQDIARPIRDRQVAKEELARNKIQLNQAKAEQNLARQTILVEQEKARVDAETIQKRATIKVANDQKVALIEQEQKLAVAKAELQAAKLEAEAIISRGKAEATVIIAQNEAAAEALRASVGAFASAGAFASYTFARRVAPSVSVIFASPDGAFGDLFKGLMPTTSPDRRASPPKGGAR